MVHYTFTSGDPIYCSLRAEDVNVVVGGFAGEAKFGLVTELKLRCHAALFQLLLKLKRTRIVCFCRSVLTPALLQNSKHYNVTASGECKFSISAR